MEVKTWVPLIVVTFQMKPFFTSMIVGQRVILASLSIFLPASTNKIVHQHPLTALTSKNDFQHPLNSMFFWKVRFLYPSGQME